MPFSPVHLAELNLLLQFPSTSTQEGIKVHASQAAPETVRAAASLFSKGLISQEDGGYLTPMGCEAVELTQKLQAMLASD
ncbi:MAG: TIGR02647 family protein [Gammaproteobacteria bacterium]|uniref:Phosphate-starvation-inducible E n=1 Tax=Marinobacter litoralis TaxID=187981 RepID=A0A3M2RFU1_9GAMM|nr:TIGR02647 family protein [Marinobacter litoralis]MBR9871793.1 TIGR02647 family protein [Gammaproteobacteria bacterium]RMJ04162.1 Phosphate-starvation-inducible E [Marinobacter litoralis]